MSISEIDQQNWNIDTLNKAYRQGYMFGLSGEPQRSCPYQSEVIAAAWEQPSLYNWLSRGPKELY